MIFQQATEASDDEEEKPSDETENKEETAAAEEPLPGCSISTPEEESLPSTSSSS